MRAWVLWIVFCLAACNGAPPPDEPPPVETTTTATEEPPEPPPGPDGREPEDYITLERAGLCVEPPAFPTGLCLELGYELQENIWAGARDPLYVADHCPWACEPNEGALFAMSSEEMVAFAQDGFRLDVDGEGFMQRLAQVNHRCAEDERFCGRTEVRRDRFAEFRDQLHVQLQVASSLRDALVGQPGHGTEYDSIQGWCRHANE